MWPIQNDAKKLKMTETLAHGYSSESTQRDSSEYQHDRVKMVFKIFISFCLDESSINVGRVKEPELSSEHFLGDSTPEQGSADGRCYK